MTPWREIRKVLACVPAATMALALLGGCERGQALTTPHGAITSSPSEAVAVTDAASTPKRSSQLRYSLGIVGYNYTDTYIDDYSVNGTSAFNLGVSTEDSGGGKTACCFGWAPGTKLPLHIQIEWTRGNDRWCRKTALLADPGPREPTTLEVHFYPDRSIEVVIADSYSRPRMKLDSAGYGYRIGKNIRAEVAADMRKDDQGADCRNGRFPLGVREEQQDRERKARP